MTNSRYLKEWDICKKIVVLENHGSAINVDVHHSSFVANVYAGYFIEINSEEAVKRTIERMTYIIENFKSKEPLKLKEEWEKEFIIALFKAIHLKTRETELVRGRMIWDDTVNRVARFKWPENTWIQ